MATLESFGNTSYGSRTNTTIPAPSGIQDGDLLLLGHLLFVASTSPPSVTLPSGFAHLADSPHTINPTAGVDSFVLRLAVKEASGESGDYTLTHSEASTQGWIARISGWDGNTPVHSGINTGDSATVTALDITPAGDNALILFTGNHYDGFSATSPPAGTTPTFTEYLDGVIFYVAAGTLVSAGATGDKSATADGTNGNPNFQATLIAVEEAGGGAPPAGIGGLYMNRRAYRPAPFRPGFGR
jgi:hypothetical protein